jgi:hypothetical protein
MTRRASTRTAFFLLLLLVVCLNKCVSQATQKLTYSGVIAFTENYIFIFDETDSTVFSLEVMQVDSVRNDVVIMVISSDGIGYVKINDNEFSYHYKISDGKRSRMRRYFFQK